MASKYMHVMVSVSMCDKISWCFPCRLKQTFLKENLISHSWWAFNDSYNCSVFWQGCTFLCPRRWAYCDRTVRLSVRLKYCHTKSLNFAFRFRKMWKHFAFRFRKMWKKGAYVILWWQALFILILFFTNEYQISLSEQITNQISFLCPP